MIIEITKKTTLEAKESVTALLFYNVFTSFLLLHCEKCVPLHA